MDTIMLTDAYLNSASKEEIISLVKQLDSEKDYNRMMGVWLDAKEEQDIDIQNIKTNFDAVKQSYDNGYWNLSAVADAVVRSRITADDYYAITGERYEEGTHDNLTAGEFVDVLIGGSE